MQYKKPFERYRRQIKIKGFGEPAQQKLSNSKILVVGAGGLGCPALQYLAAAGVGTIGIVDPDVVELSNLQRQTLYNVSDIGRAKAETVSERLRLFNPEIQFHSYPIKLDSKNTIEIIDNYDVVLDATDNFATRYMLNDACVLLNKPLIYGAILSFEGQVGVFNLSCTHNRYSTNYRDLFPKPPLPSTVPSCNETGVLGVLPGIIGTMQAAEAIKIITGIGRPLYNKILSYNLLNNLFYEFEISPAKNIHAAIPQTKRDFENFDYEWYCGTNKKSLEISVEEFEQLRTNKGITIIDVRETDELSRVDEFPFIQIPLSRFEKEIGSFVNDNPIIIFCQSGKRSLNAAQMVKEKFNNCDVYSLKGGIEELKKHRTKNLI